VTCIIHYHHRAIEERLLRLTLRNLMSFETFARRTRGVCGSVFCCFLGKQAATLFERLIEALLQLRIDAAHRIDDFPGPAKIFLPPLDVPPFGRIFSNLSNVTDLVRELDELGSGREVRCMLHLQLLPLGFIEALVIGHLADQIIDRRTERLLYLVACGFRVLQAVVENRGRKHISIVHLPDLGDQPGDFSAMPYVGTLLPSLSALLAMSVRREVRGFEDQSDV